MATFSVLWLPDVQNDFTRLWVNASSEQRQRLTNIANTVDRDLARWAQFLGHSLPSEANTRVWFLPNIDPQASVIYRVEPDGQKVYVIRLHLYEP